MDTAQQAAHVPRRSHAPLWLVETIDTVRLRSRLLVATAAGVVVVGTLAALLAPAVIPLVPIVGAALGFAAVLLGLAVAIAVDAADLRVRGPRHVRAAGGELVAILPPDADPATTDQLAAAALDARDEDAKLLLGLAAVGDVSAASAALTDSLAVSLATQDVSVLRMDLARGASDEPGLFEVANDEIRLGRAATFEPDLKLAWLPAGGNVAGALSAIPTMIASLPRDLDVLLVALPAATSRQVVRASASLDHVLLVVERGETSRVDLIAALDAFDAAGCPAQVVLLDGRSARWLGVDAGPHEAPEPVDDLDADGFDEGGFDEGEFDADDPIADGFDEGEFDADDPDDPVGLVDLDSQDVGVVSMDDAGEGWPADAVVGGDVPEDDAGDVDGADDGLDVRDDVDDGLDVRGDVDDGDDVLADDEVVEGFVAGVRILPPGRLPRRREDPAADRSPPPADDPPVASEALGDADDPSEGGGPVGPRDVSVVLGAAQAAALAGADGPTTRSDGPEESRKAPDVERDTRDQPHDDDDDTAELPLAPPLPLPPRSLPGDAVDRPPEALIDTDQLEPIVVDTDATQDDPLLTTAQLSALIDEVESRDDRR